MRIRLVLKAVVLLWSLNVCAADLYTSRYDNSRDFNDSGLIEFKNYVRKLENGKVSFSLRFTGWRAADRLY